MRVGEMIRLSGTRLVSAVLVGADKTDESLGVTTLTPDRRSPEIEVSHGRFPDARAGHR